MQEMNTDQQSGQDDGSDGEVGGIDSIIQTVESYISNPKLVTPQTLESLRDELIDLKSYLDEGDQPDQSSQPDDNKGGLTIAIGKAMGRE